jgi:tRNA 2-selenouridine synthase
LLHALRDAGAQALDLEALACHRGSVLGGLPSAPQPGQRAFESALWWTLRGFDPQRVVYVESESRKVGKLRVPDGLVGAMRAAPFHVVTLPLAQRVRLLRQEYAHYESDPDMLLGQLEALVPLHGRQRIDAWRALARQQAWDVFVERLLIEHYDPAYARSMRNHFARAQEGPALVVDSADPAAFAAAAAALCRSAA